MQKNNVHYLPCNYTSSIHYRDKLDVSQRLVAGGLNIAYGWNTHFQGPYPSQYYLSTVDQSIKISFHLSSDIPMKMKTSDGFEVICCVLFVTCFFGISLDSHSPEFTYSFFSGSFHYALFSYLM